MGRLRRLALGTSVLASLAFFFNASPSNVAKNEYWASFTADRLDQRPLPPKLSRRSHGMAGNSQHPFSLLEEKTSTSSTPFQFQPETLRRLRQANYCPKPGSAAARHPTVVLAPFDGGLVDPDDDSQRTFYVSRQHNDPRRTSSAGFFPWTRNTRDEPPRFSNSPGDDEDFSDFDAHDLPFNGTTARPPPCLRYEVPASPVRPRTAKPMSRFMFGMATMPSRALRSIPIWEDWLLPSAHISTSPLLVLVPPDVEKDLAWDVERRFQLAAASGSHLEATLRPLKADRFERRYFDLVREMWQDARVRAQIREGEEAPIDWFVLADDDTYFLSLEALSREIEIYDASSPYILGGLSENPLQIESFGRLAYGGGSILLSRGLVDLMNRPGQFEECEREFGAHFGGDSMVTFCAGKVMGTSPGRVVTYLPTLHQLDVQGHAMGVFQAGWRFSTLHHWNSWMRIFDPTHPTTIHDDFEAIMLIGRVARAIGVENWGRRYVWGLDGERDREREENVVVALGFSVMVHKKGIVDRVRLEEVEHTFVNTEIFQATRPTLEEGVAKRTYYIVDAQIASRDPTTSDANVVVLRHVDADGETFDIVWDARTPPSGAVVRVAHARDWSRGVLKRVDGFARRHLHQT